MVQSDIVDTNIQGDDTQITSSSVTALSSDQRLEQALHLIENFLVTENNVAHIKNKDAALANLDILIAQVQDILQQLDITEE